MERALADWPLENLDLLIIENVGNLVCPSSYDLGEAAKIVMLSVTEGEDKPLKYPSIFAKSELLILNKIDLLPYVSFDIAQAREYARQIHPGMEILEVSCTTGQGLDQWIEWLEKRREATESCTENVSHEADGTVAMRLANRERVSRTRDSSLWLRSRSESSVRSSQPFDCREIAC